ncbi:hypothetical protein [Paraburkholderia hospita]|uniref:hypothetical protein n=1 Tax=Paraburkholderia hospita TaxID=169430 RepID=UPI0014204717|nr:hypothetical protein [Paraburkholderia hospita]
MKQTVHERMPADELDVGPSIHQAARALRRSLDEIIGISQFEILAGPITSANRSDT